MCYNSLIAFFSKFVFQSNFKLFSKRAPFIIFSLKGSSNGGSGGGHGGSGGRSRYSYEVGQAYDSIYEPTKYGSAGGFGSQIGTTFYLIYLFFSLFFMLTNYLCKIHIMNK